YFLCAFWKYRFKHIYIFLKFETLNLNRYDLFLKKKTEAQYLEARS
ncbi:unnamed protein product, partial [Larinioides sclopetarius]